MSSFRRFLTLTALLSGFGVATLPASGAAENASLLQTYIGSWKGGGQLQGAERGNTSCRLLLKPKGENVVYAGRCSSGGGSQTFAGTLLYNPASGRFEVHAKDGAVAGKRIGDSVVFEMAGESTHGKTTSTMSFGPSAILFDFTIVDDNAATTTAHITFAKS